jgi:hypothetical protein
VLFLEERDSIFTNSYWRVAADVSKSCYEDVIASVRYDLGVVNSHKQDLTPVSELKQNLYWIIWKVDYCILTNVTSNR